MKSKKSIEFESAFGPQDERRASCPECRKETRVDTLFQGMHTNWVEGPDIGYSQENYVFECRGCETVFFARAVGTSEDYEERYDPVSGAHVRTYLTEKMLWPSVPTVPTPSWAGFKLRKHDETLHELFHDVHKAMNFDMPVLAAMGIRTAFDRFTELVGVDPNLDFESKIERLRTMGMISGTQKGVLLTQVDAGSAAAHRAWRPSSKHLEAMKEVLAALIRDHYILKPEIDELRASIPQRKN